MKEQLGNKFKYSFFGRNRGLFLTVLWIVFLIILYLAFPALRENISSAFIVVGTVIFSVLHLAWDHNVRRNHKDIVLDDRGLVLISCDGEDEEVSFKSIVGLQDFPTEYSLDDDDFLLNLMSSGVRLTTDTGRTYLIFRKIHRYNDLRGMIEKGVGVYSREQRR